ncbi:hypothetical protein V5F77_20490 [Xanthobacter sp. DSM 24535]|uniref:hypothetical protein n=1 Tax=Roseixanthobacter psychrophilus TaxID=3119917 RepID=UPI00372C65CC
MATDVERLVVSMEAQFTKYEKALARIERLTGTTTARMETRFKDMEKGVSTRIGATLGSLGSLAGIGTILGGLSLAGLIEQLRSVAGQFAEIADVADRTGLGTEQIQELRYAAEMAGGDVKDLDSGVVKFSKGLSDAARGTGDLEKVLRANGVAIKGVNGNARSTIDVLYDYADLIKNAKNPQDALNIATMAFGRSAGPALVVALQGGAEGLRTAANEGRAFGAVADDAIIRKAADIDDAFVRMSRAIKVQAGGALIEGADAVRQYQNAIIGLAAAVGAVGAGAVLGPLVQSLAAATAGAAVAAVRMNALNATILTVAAGQRLATLASAGLSTALSLLGGPWGLAITALAGTIAYLALRTDEAKEAAEQHAAAVKDFDTAVAQLKSGLPGAAEKVKALGNEHVEAAKKALAAAEAELEYAQAVGARQNLGGYASRYQVKAPADNTSEIAAAIEQGISNVKAKQKELKEWQDKVVSAGSNAPDGKPTIVPDPDADAKAKQWAKVLDQSRQRANSLQLEASLVGKSTFEATRAKVAQDLLNAAKEADIPITADLVTEVNRLATAEASATVTRDAANESYAQWNDMLRQSGDFAVDNVAALVSGYQSLNDVWKNGLGLLTQMVLKSALMGEGPLSGLFGSKATGNSPGGLFGLLGSLVPRAEGGPVSPGKRYLVGEQGPEVLTFPRSGIITPNAAVSPRASGGITFAPSTTIDARGSQMGEAQMRQILAENNRQLLRQVPAVVEQARGRQISSNRT